MKINKSPLVSIVTIIFNPIRNGRKKLLIQCLESVHDQSYDNIEHLIIDGGSNDGTLDLLKKYEKMGWVRYISEKDNGIYDAMNKGTNLSKGKYVAFLNSDDYYHGRNGVKDSIMVLEKNNAVFSYAPVLMLVEKGASICESHPHLKPNIKNVYHTMPFCHQTMFIRKDILVKEGIFDSSFKSAGDYDLVLRLCLKNYSSVFINQTFVTFRLGGISDKNRDTSIMEVSKSYYKNYRSLCDFSRSDSKEIYRPSLDNYLKNDIAIPLFLANKLKKNIYFNYEQYILDIENIRKKSFDLIEKQLFNETLLSEIYSSRTWKLMNFIKLIYRIVTFKWIFSK